MPRTLLRNPRSSPEQQVSALVAARDLLMRLCDPGQTPRVPGSVRREARALLRHYPCLRGHREPLTALLPPL